VRLLEAGRGLHLARSYHRTRSARSNELSRVWRWAHITLCCCYGFGGSLKRARVLAWMEASEYCIGMAQLPCSRRRADSGRYEPPSPKASRWGACLAWRANVISATALTMPLFAAICFGSRSCSLCPRRAESGRHQPVTVNSLLPNRCCAAQGEFASQPVT
jgi:hypothetical protein